MTYREYQQEKEKYTGLLLPEVNLCELLNLYHANEVLLQTEETKIALNKNQANLLDKVKSPFENLIKAAYLDWKKGNRMLSYRMKALEESGLIAIELKDIFVSGPSFLGKAKYENYFEISEGPQYQRARIIGVRSRPSFPVLEYFRITRPQYQEIH